ncbi:CXXX repeat peptide maturase [Muribaculum intestinale]|uniref:CXXX repeat peptide maturase n=1 Tax=Muribaculum intestinale TaxID=1796646 RepID=UPI002431BF9D|nr:CXXX repeat peptide maturase [Muribaculum intestinale]
MKENLTLQFLYPDYEIPSDYKSEIAKTFHADIVSSTSEDLVLREIADVVVFDSFAGLNFFPFNKEQTYVFRSTVKDFLDSHRMLYPILPLINRANIVFTDLLSITKEDELDYAKVLEALNYKIADEYKSGHGIQINLLTDRMLLDGMNNCNAGDETIALCPDGKFYVCPAFYADKEIAFPIGNSMDGLDIKNPQLYKISHAPICRICDAYQCRRCIWLNKKATLEINTPSHEQCVISHIERNASRKLLALIREIGQFLPEKEIPEISYLDPFDKIQDNQ